MNSAYAARENPAVPFPPLHKKDGLQLHCFGQFALYRGLERIPIGSKKARELLALLVLEGGGPISKRWIASVLWPESTLSHARDCLYKVLAWLNAKPELCQGVGLTCVRESISIRMDTLWVDTVEFDRCYAKRSDPSYCQRAAALYTGPLLWRDCYDWTDEAQSRYESRYSEILEALALHHRALSSEGKSEI